MSGKLDGKVAIVTGGAVGIGKHYCDALAAEGARVVIADIADGTETAAEINSAHGQGAAIAVQADVSDEASVTSLVETAVSEMGRIDILVNNAAVFSTLPVAGYEEIDVDLWDKVMSVNVRGLFLMAKHVGPVMQKQSYGKIINIGSGTANKGMPNMLHYVTSKGAVLGFTRALSRELGKDNICVNTLSPGFILSDSILENEKHVDMAREPVRNSRAIKRDAYPDDLLGTLVFLASPDSDFLTGQTIAVDGGSVNT